MQGLPMRFVLSLTFILSDLYYAHPWIMLRANHIGERCVLVGCRDSRCAAVLGNWYRYLLFAYPYGGGQILLYSYTFRNCWLLAEILVVTLNGSSSSSPPQVQCLLSKNNSLSGRKGMMFAGLLVIPGGFLILCIILDNHWLSVTPPIVIMAGERYSISQTFPAKLVL